MSQAFQDARSDQERAQSSTCGKTEATVISLEEDSHTRGTTSVRLASHISGLESSDVLEVQSFPRRDSTTRLAEAQSLNIPDPPEFKFSEECK